MDKELEVRARYAAGVTNHIAKLIEDLLDEIEALERTIIVMSSPDWPPPEEPIGKTYTLDELKRMVDGQRT